MTAAISSEGLEQLPSDVRDNEPLGARGGDLGGDSGGERDGGREGSFFEVMYASEARIAIRGASSRSLGCVSSFQGGANLNISLITKHLVVYWLVKAPFTSL